MLLLCPQVVPEGTKKECDQLADVEWRTESKGKDTMSFDDFYESIFLFVDVWCEGMSTAQYLKFTTDLLKSLLSQTWFTTSETFLRQQSSTYKIEDTPPIDNIEEEIAKAQARLASMAPSVPPVNLYREACQRVAVRTSKDVSAKLMQAGSMKTLELPEAGLTTLLPLLDVLLRNRELQKIDLSKNRLDCRSLELLFTVLLWHPKLVTLDISANPGTSTRAVRALYQLLCRNTALRKLRYAGTVAKMYEARLRSQLDFNFHSQAIGSKDYHQLRKAFRQIDVAAEGRVELQDFVDWFGVNQLRSRKQAPAQAAGTGQLQVRRALAYAFTGPTVLKDGNQASHPPSQLTKWWGSRYRGGGGDFVAL